MKKILIALCLLSATLSQAQNLSAVKVGSRIDVTLDGAYFTSYRCTPDEKYPFFFPVNAPSGAGITSMRNGQYPHHSSLFFGCDKVNEGNYWQEGLDRGQIISEGTKLVVEKGKEIVITDACNWKRPDAEQPFRDTRKITITAPSKTLRQIDFDVTVEALTNVEIKTTNHAFFSARVAPDISVLYSNTLINAEGKQTQKETSGVASPWMAAYGKRGNGKSEGIAILQHPSNALIAQTKWLTRDYGFFSPTPFQWPEQKTGTSIKKGEKMTFRYRVLVFEGDPTSVQIAERYADFSKQP
jgi:hypothetical protein